MLAWMNLKISIPDQNLRSVGRAAGVPDTGSAGSGLGLGSRDGGNGVGSNDGGGGNGSAGGSTDGDGGVDHGRHAGRDLDDANLGGAVLERGSRSRNGEDSSEDGGETHVD